MPKARSRTDLHTHGISTLTYVRNSRTFASYVGVTSNQNNGIALSARANTKSIGAALGRSFKRSLQAAQIAELEAASGRKTTSKRPDRIAARFAQRSGQPSEARTVEAER